MGNATIHVDKANGTFDQPITLLVYGGKSKVPIREMDSFQELKFNKQNVFGT